MKLLSKLSAYPNVWGSLASGICLAHCIATPFLFAAHTSGHVQGHHAHPEWWGFIDILFLAVSFLAVYWSARFSSKKWLSYALWTSWAVLALIILNEKFGLLQLAEELIYVPSLALIIFHLYNRKYCQCETKECYECKT